MQLVTYILSKFAHLMMSGNWNLCILNGGWQKHITHPSYDIEQERKSARRKSVRVTINDRLMIKSLIYQGCNQFRIWEQPEMADSDSAEFTSDPRARVVCKIGYRRCVLWCNEQITCVQKSQDHLNRVVPFHCGILLEESRGTRGGILSSILRRREGKRRTMSKPNSAEIRN
jgi:hypothetical protein